MSAKTSALAMTFEWIMIRLLYTFLLVQTFLTLGFDLLNTLTMAIINFALIQEHQCFTNLYILYLNCRSRFYDEDGDLAHEFYEEKDINGQTVMEQHWRNLRPEVNVLNFVNVYKNMKDHVANYFGRLQFLIYFGGRFKILNYQQIEVPFINYLSASTSNS